VVVRTSKKAYFPYSRNNDISYSLSQVCIPPQATPDPPPPTVPGGFPPTTVSSEVKDGLSEGSSLPETGLTQKQITEQVRRMSFADPPAPMIELLPDDILLDVFTTYVNDEEQIQQWPTLVHVCRRWRNLILASPGRLGLRLLCTAGMPLSDTLRVWPTLPIFIFGPDDPASLVEGVSDVVASLYHCERVHQVALPDVPICALEKLAAAMRKPFPALERLELGANPDTAPAPSLPHEFLGGSAPSLQLLRLIGIPFPSLETTLPSFSQLVELSLKDIPHSGYFPPEAIVTGIAKLSRLQKLRLHFRSPLSRPPQEDRCLPPPTRTVLPALSLLDFRGVSEYLEDLVAQIDAPVLEEIRTVFFHQLVFDTPQLLQFLNRTNVLGTSNRADVLLDGDFARVSLYQQDQTVERRTLVLSIKSGASDWQLWSLAQVCSAFLPPLSTLECLYIRQGSVQPQWDDDMENAQWLELLKPFAASKNLYLHKELVPRVGRALQELAGEAVVPLPEVQDIFTLAPLPSETVREAFGEFVSQRELSGRPVAVHAGWSRGML